MGPGYNDYYLDDQGEVQSMSDLAQDAADTAYALVDAIESTQSDAQSDE